MAVFIWMVALSALQLVCCEELAADGSMIDEPRTYTVSFFQFDTKQLLGVDEARTTSKKEIKASDLEKRSKVLQAKNTTGRTRNMNPLDPNPKPSEAEAALSLPHPRPLDDIKTGESQNKNRTVTLRKLPASHHVKKVSDDVDALRSSIYTPAKGNSTNAHRKSYSSAKPSSNLKNFAQEANMSKKSDEEGPETIQETKRTILYAQVKNASLLGNVTILPNVMAAESQLPNKRTPEILPGHSKSDSEKRRHRQLVLQFVPVYHVSPKDHGLTYQRGSIKHPKHSLYPQCHVCPSNSTYAQCVKHSTLTKCDNGLSNICFTKSLKTRDAISYEMGCADHSRCSSARAFPCKDGSKSCFTCCQWDRCNSSPHHGNYELDELNLDQLQGSTNSAAHSINFSSNLAVIGSLIVFLLLR